jgi:small-conductance mechanosensitive channel
MDRITIILGALGVGIGLGLQALVNNLVSGLILAFEKPVNVGDVIEIDDNPGIMKSIGFRSSVIVKVDGSQVVIPNGDLLNLHLVNWSNGKSKRRVELLVGVAYGTDLEKARKILLDVMKNNKLVLPNPPPMVLAQDFKDSCIEFRCNFWVGSFMEGSYAKSEIIHAIVAAFRENDIVIPFPQRDLHIKEKPSENTAKPEPL